MRDFVNFCQEKDLIEIQEDGTVMWTCFEDCAKQKANHKEKFAGGRDGRKDLSDDYKDPCGHMGTVWPFKVTASKKACKPVAPVGK